ncbi:LysM domain-containing protein [uncultured Selenomonas sp.]|uniref:LysM peptidoglycan-binding domain-containing protein n=1 Tax=uncultured Selenomonas sp. TaxID=159275 RepID=UPI0028D7769A|nr:LysM domain-containing protein [uncultured Selenomonas sp.]
MDAKKIITGSCVIGAALLCAGMEAYDDGKNAILVEETYVVKSGDTLWGIAEEYVAKNTGTRRYILEYKEGIYENNPWLVERKGEIFPGDEIKVTYWKKGDSK